MSSEEWSYDVESFVSVDWRGVEGWNVASATLPGAVVIVTHYVDEVQVAVG